MYHVWNWREKNKKITGLLLTNTLDNYAETGSEYTKILVGYNKLQWVKNTTLWSCIFTLIMSYPFMKYFDIYGALLVITFSYFLNGFLGYYYTKKLLS